MSQSVILDSGPLGQISHPDPTRHSEIKAWFDELLARGVSVFIPAIADFEVRRSLILAKRTRSLSRLDALQSRAVFMAISAAELRLAARLWAMARERGRSVGDPKELNADVILAAQAVSLVDAVVATDNVGHLGLFVEARPWRSIAP